MGIFDWIRQRSEEDDERVQRVNEAFDKYRDGEIDSQELIDTVKYESFEAELSYQNRKAAREFGIETED